MANGGLGIRKLTAFNKAFLGKWFWRFGVCDCFQIWGRMDGGWSYMLGRGLMDVVFEGVLKWVGRCLVCIFGLRLV